MPGIRETRILPYSAEQMFDLVADVARYPEFLPWVIATRVKSGTDTEMVADMLVGFKALRDLDNVWHFRALGQGGCELDFCVDFTFKNRMFEMLAGQYFDRAFRKMVAAFETRAHELYGNKSSSATS